MSEELRAFLAPRSEVVMIGPERGPARPPSNGIARYVSSHGSTRYVLYERGLAASVLQVVSRDGKKATIANVYTASTHRRRGLAAQLLARARRDFLAVEHSSHLSPEGAAWKATVRDERSRGRRA